MIDKAVFKIIMTNNYSFSGNNLSIGWVGMQREHREESWEIFREDRLCSYVVVLECLDEDLGFYSTGNDKPLKNFRLSKKINSM